jgi:Na+/H+ antiporter NhaD/arsenite permease-like protein
VEQVVAGDANDPPDEAAPYDRWQTVKGLVVAGVLVVVFLATDWPRDVAALVGAGVLLLSARFHSSRVMGLIDWELLVLFMGLFVVNAALAHTGLTQQAVQWLAVQGVRLGDPGPLFAATLVLSNLVSNVPAVMLLLPAAEGAHAGPTLALVSTLAGNLLIVGSIANIIVVGAARRSGVVIDWRRHARTGVPVTLATLAIAAAWIAWRAG